MKMGSVAVQKGDRVAMGTVLGQIGLSGRTQFPHLHFSVQHRGTVVDPFDPDGVIQCGQTDAKTLWAVPPPIQPGGLIEIGFSPDKPDATAIKAGTAPETVEAEARNLFLWARAYGMLFGDEVHISVKGPDGFKLEKVVRQNRDQALIIRSIGQARKTATWPLGDYDGMVTIIRRGDVLDIKSVTMTVE